MMNIQEVQRISMEVLDFLTWIEAEVLEIWKHGQKCVKSLFYSLHRTSTFNQHLTRIQVPPSSFPSGLQKAQSSHLVLPSHQYWWIHIDEVTLIQRWLWDVYTQKWVGANCVSYEYVQNQVSINRRLNNYLLHNHFISFSKQKRQLVQCSLNFFFQTWRVQESAYTSN